MTKRIRVCGALLAVFATVTAQAQSETGSAIDDPQDFVFWSADYVDAAAERLYASLGDKDLVWETMGNYEGHSVYLVLRGKTDTPELHETESDVQITIRGSATSVVGGTLVDAIKMPRKQQRGTAIEGGKHRQLTPGAMMHIPPGIPHQLQIDPGEPYLYLLIKIDEEPLL
ncbi:MAG: cupin domain-containing protein [Woeseiaceae bacterium]|nr:cupin domain-containing protein [Woeseiaceae bacterium]